MISNGREGIKKIQAATSTTARKAKESELGFRESVFLYLPYFNVIRQTIVDPMHNLFSGNLLVLESEKFFAHIWIWIREG